jgi:hypothetical protein
MISSMLDPHHKHLGFPNSTQKTAANVKLVDLGEAVEIGRAAIPEAGGDEEPTLSDTDEGNSNTGASQSQVSAMAQLLGEHYRPTSQCESGIEAALKNFLREAPQPLDCTPTGWGKVNGIRFPRLAK